DFVFISQVTMFSAMALAITLIGVFCLTMFETEYRRKEIAIRKVLGCSETGIISMLVSLYIIILFIAFAIASPIAWILGNEWLHSFEERTVIYWWIFPLALIIIGFVLITTIVIQSWKVANMNPMESVRTE
ncbi:MAG: FtsX-like permease family protein, partial [Bacteroidaceae bacterium]|nr:FtsX-like permease family protein [Bacteroidaceae bacterium]